MSGVQFEIRVITNDGAAEVREIKSELTETGKAATETGDRLKKIGDAAFTFNNISQAIGNVVGELNKAVQPGIDFNSSLKEMQAITGASDELLNKLGDSARQNAKDFGLSAAGGVEEYKLLLSQLGPELAKTPDALKEMGRDASILSKQLSGDTTAATEILTTAMNQYGISIKDPIAATKAMGEMMDIMSNAAKEGSAELPQIKSALEQAGMMAKTANVSFAETNAAIQVLDASGKKGAEGGVALRNILAEIGQGNFMNKMSLDMLKAAGIDTVALADKNKTLAERLQLLTPIMGDNAAMTQLFGRENVAAGIALVSHANDVAELTGKLNVQGTAQEMANITMSSFSERMARANAWAKDLGISLFNMTSGFLPFIQIGMGALQTMTNLGGAVQAFNIIAGTSFGKSIASLLTGMGTWIASTISATAAQWGLNVAMDANPIGILIAAIGAAIAIIAVLVHYWDDITASIAAFATWIWEHNPFSFLINVVDKVFPGFKNAMGALWDWVKDKFMVLFGWIEKAWGFIKKIFGGGDEANLNVNEQSVKEYAVNVTQGISTANENVQSTSPLAGYDPRAGRGESDKKNEKINDTASRITSGGAKATTINLTIHKLQDQTVIHTTNLAMGGKEAAAKIVEYITEALQSMNGSLNPA